MRPSLTSCMVLLPTRLGTRLLANGISQAVNRRVGQGNERDANLRRNSFTRVGKPSFPGAELSFTRRYGPFTKTLLLSHIRDGNIPSSEIEAKLRSIRSEAVRA